MRPPLSKLADCVVEFCESQHFLLLDADLKDGAEPLLAHWCDEAGDVVSTEAIQRGLRSVARLDVPLTQRRRFPELLEGFLEFLPTTGRFPLADEWADRVQRLAPEYQTDLRDDGSVRGQTVRRVGVEVGRNDPCPCGSGKKYKKCCLGLLGS